MDLDIIDRSCLETRYLIFKLFSVRRQTIDIAKDLMQRRSFTQLWFLHRHWIIRSNIRRCSQFIIWISRNVGGNPTPTGRINYFKKACEELKTKFQGLSIWVSVELLLRSCETHIYPSLSFRPVGFGANRCPSRVINAKSKGLLTGTLQRK